MFEAVEFIEDDLPDAELVALVDAIAAPVIAAVDCLDCANCCRTIDVYLVPADVDRLANGLDLPRETFIADYVDQEAASVVEEWGKFRERPCAFLAGKRCTHYDLRPDACRAYPQFTPDFRWTLADTLEGAGRCPIIYHVLDRLFDHLVGG